MLRNNSDHSVIIVAPIGQDAGAMAQVLSESGVQAQVGTALTDCFASDVVSVGALLMTQEALQSPELPRMLEWLQAQPPWSELPVIVLISGGGESRWAKLLNLIAAAAGSLTLLERPIASMTLLHSIQVALRSRRRQYQVRDLLNLKDAQQKAIEESEERYRTLIEQVSDYAIYRTDTSGHPSSWNEGVRRILGFEREDFIGADVSRVVFRDEDREAGVAEGELRAAAENGSASFNRWMQRKDGTSFYGRSLTTALRDKEGQLIGFSKVLRDETVEKQLQDALVEARARLESHAQLLEKAVSERTRDLHSTNEQLEAFVYSIAHDLRSPLRSMIGYSQLLVDDFRPELSESARHLLNRIQASAEFMDKLLLDLLAFGRTARAEIELVPVDVMRTWQMALFQCATQIEQTSAEVETVPPFPMVLAHEATLGQILANLLGNALKFVTPGIAPHVSFWAEQAERHVRLWIKDNGVGIPSDQHERIFRVFERLHGTRYQGTGIGLSIVRKGVERMDGRVGVQSNLGHGAAFWVELRKA
ncbi:MAG TPA: ATP-binding protein [Verrucomicrobiae bacterium]|nr:ATP-binding protein [Verrucomicrobiae bacterium]